MFKSVFKRKAKEIKFGTNVPFEDAYIALKEGYLIRHSNNTNYVYIMLNKIIFCLNTNKRGDQSECHVIDSFDKFTMDIEKWQIYPTSMLGYQEFLPEKVIFDRWGNRE